MKQHISTRRTAAAAAVALSSLVVACGSSGGNGEDGKSADQIVKDAQSALASATSYHITGSVAADSGSVSFDVEVAGKDVASGHMTTNGVTFDFISTGGKLYLHGKQFFAKLDPKVADTIGDKWVTASGNADMEDAVSQISEFTDPSQLADSLGSSGGPYTKGSTTTVDGQPAIAVKGKEGELDVALNGKPYPVHLDAGSHGKADINQYDAHFDVKAPSGALDASALDNSSSSDSASSSDSTTTQAVVDATKVRDGVLQVAEGTITESSGSVDDAWGVASVVTSKLPSSIDVAVQTGDTSNLPAASPTRVVLYGAETSSGDLFVVVVQDTSGNCEIGALAGNPPNGDPTSKSLPAGTDCNAANAIKALQS